MRLAQVLAQRKLLSATLLRSIPGSNTMEDGQLGSALVEARLLTTDQLAEALGDIQGVPPALEADFQRADPSWRKRLRSHQAAKLRCIPLYLTQDRRVAVAMVDPSHPGTLDELSFALGASIEPMVTSESALARHLELMYAMPRRRTTGFNPVVIPGFADDAGAVGTARVAEEDQRLQMVRSAGASPQATLPYDPTPAIRVPTPPARAKSKKETHSYLATVEEMPLFVPSEPNAPAQVAAEPQTPIPPMVSVTGSDRAVELILSSPDRQAAADNLFAFMRSCFGAGAMFSVNGVFASGRFGYNEGVECPAVESLLFSLSLPSCFRTAHTRGTMFHGAPLPEGESIHGPLWAALRCSPPREVLVAPVVAAGQVSLMLYAHARKQARIEKSAVSRMEHVCSALANTLIRLAG